MERSNASRGSVERWLPLVQDLKTLLLEQGDLFVFARVKGSWFNRHYRARRQLPILRLSVDADTWEVNLMAPGLVRRNPLGKEAMHLSAFLASMEAATFSHPHCYVVLSDEMTLNLEGMRALAKIRGSEWTGANLDSLEEDEYVARLDLPIQEVTVSFNAGLQRVLLDVQVLRPAV